MAFFNRRSFLRNLTALLGTGSLISWSLPSQASAPPVRRQTIYLWPEGSPNDQVHAKYGRPRLDLFIPETPVGPPRAAIVVVPGGGYYVLSPHEGVPVAEMFAGENMVSAVLTYHVSPEYHPRPLSDVARAIRLLRREAKSLNLDPEKIGIIGFSAGGHLAATVATQPELYRDPADDLASRFSARPNRLMLGYPVISFQPGYGHLGSAGGLFGKDPGPALLHQLSNELHVTAQNPPVFLFHTADDPVVDVENSLRFASACHRQKVPVALHIYPKGPHGVGLAHNYPELKSWTSLLLDWLGDCR